jgi:hypothetical protein
MRKSGFVATVAMVALSATVAFGKSTSYIGGRMKVTGTLSAVSTPPGSDQGPCPSPTYAKNCPAAPNGMTNCFCLQVMNATVKGGRIGQGTAILSVSQDAGDGNGASSPSGGQTSAWPVFAGAVFTDSKTGAQATFNISGSLYHPPNQPQGSTTLLLTPGSNYSDASGGPTLGKVTGTVEFYAPYSVNLTFIPY